MASLFSEAIVSSYGEALDFALTKAGKDSDFKLKTEQKSIIEAAVDFFTPFARTVTFNRISCQFSYLGPLHNLELLGIVQFVSAFQQGSPLSRSFRNIVDGIAASPEVRSEATANPFINPHYTISSVFRDL